LLQGTKPLKKIILSNAYYTAPYCAAFNPAAIAKAKELGYELQILDGEGNQQRQLEHARIAISNAAGFIYFPADVAGSIPIVEALNKSKLPYVIVNNYTLDALRANNVPCYVGTNVKQAWTQHGYTGQTAFFQTEEMSWRLREPRAMRRPSRLTKPLMKTSKGQT